MNILISPQAFKGCLSAKEVVEAIQTGIHRYRPHASTFTLPVEFAKDQSLSLITMAAEQAIRFIDTPLYTS
ncbi:MAG: glycerate kinase [Waddliaceae bacterium]